MKNHHFIGLPTEIQVRKFAAEKKWTDKEKMTLNNYRTHYRILLLLLMTIMSSELVGAQNVRHIAGTVTDIAGNPVAGAGIVAYGGKGRTYGTSADADGRFSFDLPDSIGTFKTVMLGYCDEIVRINTESTKYNIIMKERTETVSDVVVTGYVDKKKESYTGALSVIKRDQIEKLTHSNVLNIIQLQAPGFELQDDIQNGSNPNKVPDMVLRGRSSFIEGDQTNVPLFILDGTEVDITYIFDMPAEDIESISILKDASATSFYGSKAANGVIVITTRPTQYGKLQVSYSGNMQVSVPDLSDYRLLNAADKLEYERQAGIYGNFTGSSSTDIAWQKVYYEKLDRVNAGVNTDWKRLALRTGLTHLHNVMLSGGSRDFRYNVSGNINSTLGIMDESGRTSSSLRINITYGSLSKLFIQNIASFSAARSKDVPYGKFSDYVRLNPYDMPYNADGSLNTELSFNTANPLYEKQLSSYIHSSSDSFIDTFKLRWNIVEGFRAEATLSYTLTKSGGETFYSPKSQRFNTTADPKKKGSSDVNDGTSNTLSGNAFLVWNKSWGETLAQTSSLSLTGGVNVEATKSDTHSFSALGILSDKLEHPSMATGYAESHPGGGENRSRMLGFYANANYIFGNRYFADLSVRYEGSSKFGTDNRFAPFGSIGLGWNVHKEKFMQGTKISLLKLRSSIGLVGNANFNPYQARLSYKYSSDLYYNGNIGAVPVSMVNPHLKWERSLKRNIGLDFGVFSDKLTGSIDYYHDTTNSLVMDISKPPHIGFSSAKENLGKISNSGVEISVRGNVLQRKDLNLNLFLNMSHNTNKILQISDYLKNLNEKNEASSSSVLPASFYQEGESMTALKVMRSAGINPANGREVFIDKNGNYTYEYSYKDKYVAGDTTPVVNGSFGASFSWKSLDFSMTFAYRLGATVYNQTLATKVEGGNPRENADRRVFYDRWKQPGDMAKYKNIASREVTPVTDRFVAKEYALDGSSLKVSYTLPQNWITRIHLRRAMVSLSTGDLFNWSSIRRERGLDYPFARTFQFSLSLNI